MLTLALLLTVAGVSLYVLSPALLIYSTHPFPVYLFLAGAVLAASRARKRTLGVGVGLIAAVLGGAIFYLHSVHSRVTAAALNVSIGQPMPEITLPTSTGDTFTSTALRDRQGALYLFYRGDWCPFCRTELSAMNEYYERIRGAGVELYAISVDPPEVSERLRQRLSVPFTFLSDSQGRILDAIGIRHVGGHDGKDIAYPAQILVDRHGVIRWTFRGDSYRQRANPEEVLEAIARLAP